MAVEQAGKAYKTGEKEKKAPIHSAREGDSSESKRRPDLLFIDDNALVRETVKTLLQQEHYKVLASDDAFTGLCLLAGHRPFNVLIDAGMQGLSGKHFCMLVKSLLPFRSTRLIILLQHAHVQDQARALTAGADAVLIKPFGKNELLSQMETARGKSSVSLLSEARLKVRSHGISCLGKLEQALSDFCSAESPEKRLDAYELMQKQFERYLLLQQFYLESNTVIHDEQLRNICSRLGRQQTDRENAEYRQTMIRFYQLLDGIS